MSAQRPLTPKQAEVLAWIAAGCNEDVYPEGFVHRIVARALESRRYVAISGHGQTWTAVVTIDGLARLEEELRPLEPEPEPEPDPRDRAADALWRIVLDAGGTLTVDVSNDPTDYVSICAWSIRSSARPPAKALEMRSPGTWGSTIREIRIVDHLPDLFRASPVAFPASVHRYHPAVAAGMDKKQIRGVPRELAARGARVLNAIAIEAEKRSMLVQTPSEATAHLSRFECQYVEKAHLAIVTAGGSYGVTLREVVGTPSVARQAEGLHSTGKLEIRVDGPTFPYGGLPFRDRWSFRVEDLLPEFFHALQIHSYMAEQRDIARQEDAARKQIRQKMEEEEARIAFHEHEKHILLLRQLEEWKRYKDMLTFLEEMRTAVSAITDRDALAAGEVWLDWAMAHVSDSNPLSKPLKPPADREPTTDELKQHFKQKPSFGNWNLPTPDRRG